MTNAGIGVTHAKTFLSTLNLPSPHHKTVAAREREAGAAIQSFAIDSCKKAVEEEVQDGGEGLTVSYDAGWSKRGSGRSYNSNTGHSVLIGAKSRKCLKFAVRTKVCNVCDCAKSRHQDPKPHKCFKNWEGSSKAMEPDMAYSMIKDLADEGHQVDKLVMDNDATTMHKVKQINDNIQKISDKNHTKKGVVNSLYNLANKHKALKNKKTLNYIVKMFTYAFQQKSGDPQGLVQRLDEIVPHIFGSHDNCSPSWCSYNKNPSGFKYHSLPYGRALTDSALRSDLEKLVQQYQNKSELLAHQGSSQANESFNNTVASKAPKARYFYEMPLWICLFFPFFLLFFTFHGFRMITHDWFIVLT